jgi:ABC-type enterochelin transport system substrate-binding protein
MGKRRIWILGLLVTASLVLSGCATKSAQTKKSSNQDYEYVYITGSNIRIKVRKGERPVYKGSNAVATMDANDVHDAFQVPQGVVNPTN